VKKIQNPIRKLNRYKGIDGPVGQGGVILILFIIIAICILPIVITVLLSLKSNYEMAFSVWNLPKTPKWSNWNVGFAQILPSMLNSVIICLTATICSVFLSLLVAFAFTRYNFWGKEVIFSMIIALMVIPSVLTLTPQYLLILNLGIKDTWLALLLPYIAGGQVGAIFLFRTFLGQQPADLFEAARIDGAGNWRMFFKISMPLAIPIIAVQSITSFSSWYNDYLWPLLVIDSRGKQTLMAVLQTLTAQYTGQSSEQGTAYAMYILSGIPLIISTLIGLKYFINGDFASGMKM
jgi:ABC-type glycerol-3-phosphate transport system permease component